MMLVGLSVFGTLLVPLWVVGFGYLWKKLNVESFIANDAASN